MTGILVLNKPKGFTSFDAVAAVRKICSEKKCGHTGTLDPMATGVLPLLLGGATRFGEILPDHDKTYIAKLKLGIRTDTLDITGKVLSKENVKTGLSAFLETAEQFKGKTEQMPPMYSAVSVNGQRLYKLARQGIEVERPTREVTVYSLDVISSDENSGEYEIRVSCSSGTYIRSLISDIGDKLGCGAVMTELNRVKANSFTIEESVTIEDLKAAKELNEIKRFLIPVDSALKAYKSVTVTQAQATRFLNGGALDTARLTDCKDKCLYRVYSPDGHFLGVGSNTDGLSLNIKKILTER
ncbi:MAG: tRNA pseudouridine(55) synthase TruB [Clostridia bacterium]|nr:tRNA pseudouridine(55) synthase TruB [Clostridia bacterium]